MFDSLLVIAPHPDDDILGCGGLMHRMASMDARVTVAYLYAEDLVRYEEGRAALEGIAEHIYVYSFSDRFDRPVKEVAAWIEDVLETEKPQAVALPNSYAHHQDHRKTAEAALIALRPSGATGRHRPPVVLEYEMASDAWPPRQSITPPITVELSYEDVLYKHNGMMLHSSQVRPSPSDRSSTTIAALAQLRGSQAGVMFGEAYTVLRYLV